MVLVAINIASAIWDVRKSQERTERRAERYYSNMTRLLAEQTAASLDAVDLILRDAVRTGASRQVAAMLPRVGEELVRVPQIGAMLVLDAHGEVLARTGSTPAYDPDPVERPYLAFHRDHPGEALHLGQPYRVAPGGQWRFMLSRRLNDAEGRFDGVVAAAVEVESFDRLYHAIDIGEGGFLTVLTDQGVLITRVPDPGNVRGRSFAGGRIMAGIRAHERFEGWTTSPISDERVLLATSLVRGFPRSLPR